MEFMYFLLGLLPIIWLIIALIVLKMPTYKAAMGSLIVAIVLAMLVWRLPAMNVLTATLEGFANAAWPIILVIIAAMFTYNLTLKTGAMEVIKQMLSSVTSDKRILVLILAWCFGGFMEGMAGFGTAIAIPAGMLYAMGFDPIFSCLVCLIANGVPTPFGSIGIPTVTLAGLVGLENTTLSFYTAIQLAPFILLCPILIVMATGKGLKALKGVLPVTLASGISFFIPTLIIGNFVGAELAVVVGSVCSLFVTILLGSKVKPNPEYEMKQTQKKPLAIKDCVKAWSPFICIFFFLLLTSKLVAPINQSLARFSSSVQFYCGDNPNTLTFAWINTPGIWIFISAFIGGKIQGATLQDFKTVFVSTLKQMKATMITMCSVLGCAKVMGYAGMIAAIANFAIGITGPFYPIVAPWIGALGCFVTGSGTSSGVFFGAVQMSAAQALGANTYWIVALNSMGVAAGKMLSPQSIAIALSSVQKEGEDSKLLGKILPYGALFLVLMSIYAFIGAKIL
ncbi:MAG: L-lactate permease [Floccifex sp.]